MAAIQLHECTTTHIEKHSLATQNYRIESRLLEGAPFSGHSQVMALSGIDLCYRKNDGRLAEHGEVHKNRLLLIFPECKQEVFYRSRIYTADDQIMASSEQEIFGIYPREFSSHSCAIDLDLLKDYFTPEEMEGFERVLNTESCRFNVNQSCKARLRQLIQQTLSAFQVQGDNQSAVQGLRQAVCAAVFDYTMSYMPATNPPKHNRKLRLVNRCMDYLKSKPASEICIATMASSVHASIRTVQYSFMDVLGISPMQYIIALRMNEIRHKIIASAEQGLLIKDIIGAYGITNPGRFSHEYLGFFGEYPKETRKRVLR